MSINKAPESLQGPGHMIVAIVPEYTHVMIQFTDPDWWVHLTPAEARHLAGLLVNKAEDIEKTTQEKQNN